MLVFLTQASHPADEIAQHQKCAADDAEGQSRGSASIEIHETNCARWEHCATLVGRAVGGTTRPYGRLSPSGAVSLAAFAICRKSPLTGILTTFAPRPVPYFR